MLGSLKSFVNLGLLYEKLYDFVCGKHPYCYPWHYQWHFTKDAHLWQKVALLNLKGKILDVGCGNKPYKKWLDPLNVQEYTGLDVIEGAEVDIKVSPADVWPLESNSFDSVLIAQVLEHVEDLSHTLSEVHRVLKEDGMLLITVPFLYPLHGAPFDFRRFTSYGLKNMLSSNYEILSMDTPGKLGSVLASILLTGIENNLNSNFMSRLMKGILFPAWVVFSFLINIICLAINFIDVSGSHYCNVCVVARKKKI